MASPVSIEVDRLYRFDNGSQLKAFVDITVGGQFTVKGFKVVDGKKGMFVSMPSEVGKDGKWYETFKPLTKEAEDELNKVILGAYQQ